MHQLIPIVRFLDQLLMFVVIIKWVIECDRCTASRQLLRYQASLNLKYCFYEELFNIFKFCGVWIIWIFWRLYLLIKYILLGINCDLLSDLSHDPFLIVIIVIIMLSLQRGDFEWKMENLLSKVFWPLLYARLATQILHVTSNRLRS